MHNVAQAIHRILSGERAQELTAAITQFYRSPGSAGYHAATALVAQHLRAIGITELSSTRYPLDGETVFLNQTMPLAWEPYAASVRVEAPTQQEIVNFSETPSTLACWSQPTPAGGLTAELVDVGTGERDEDFADPSLAGKVVFIHHTEHRAAWVHAATQAMERGAAGILTDYLLYETPPFRTRQALPDAVQLLRLPNRMGQHNTWACTVDKPTGDRLRELLALGPVTVHADIRCRLFKGEGQNLLATIPGRERPEESVLFIAHTSAATKPAANCAAGPALMVEIARTLHHLIEQGSIRRPRRSIHFLFVVEGLGSLAYIDAHRDELNSIKAAFCLDSVGHAQAICRSLLLFYRHPDSSPSFINDYFAGIMERAPKDTHWVFRNDHSLSEVKFEQAPYTPWSDNHYWATFGVPSPLIMSWPDKYFHTQLLTAEKTDPDVFRRAGTTTALAAYEIADAGVEGALAIAEEVLARSVARLRQRAARAVCALSLAADGNDGVDARTELAEQAFEELSYFASRDQKAIRSVCALLTDEISSDVETHLTEQSREIQQQMEAARRQIVVALERLGAGNGS